MFTVLLIVFGTYVSTRMDVDVFPDLTAPTVAVLTEAPGMAPEEVEKLVSFHIETAVNGATGVRRVRSSSAAGISVVWVEFEWDTDVFKARQIVNEKLTTIASRLPAEAGQPTLAPQSSIMGEIMLIGIKSEKDSSGKNIISPGELRTTAEWHIRPRLLATGGVAQVVVLGGEKLQYQILASPDKMNLYGVSLKELTEAAEYSGGNSSGGFLNAYSNEYVIKGVGRTTETDEIAASVIKQNNGMPVRIGDVSEVKIAGGPKIGDASLNAEEAVIMTVQKQPGINTIDLSEKIDAALEEIRKNLPPGILIDSDIFRQSDFIHASIDNIQKVLLEGSFFVALILFLFLMNWRATAISLLAIPVSLLVSILALSWAGFSINTMSLGGMAIAIGAIVDDAIIDVENVYRRLRENSLLPEEQKRNKFDVILDASMEIRTSIVNATIIIVIAFIPLFFLSGMEGKLLEPLGIAFIVSLLASLLVSLTITPVLGSYLLANEKMLSRHSKESHLISFLKSVYASTLDFVFRHKKKVLYSTVALFLFSIFMFSRLGRSFLPEFNEGSLVISAVTMPGISLEESNKTGKLIEKKLLSVPGINTVTRRTGRAELDEHAQGVNSSEIDAPFELNGRSREEFLEQVRNELSGIPGVNITIGQPIGHRIDHMLSGTRANIAIKIFGTDLNQLYRISQEIKSAIGDLEGLVDVGVELQTEIPQIQIRAKREMLALYGIRVGDFNAFISTALGGKIVSSIQEGGRSHDLVVRFEENYRSDIESIRNTLIDAGDDKKVPLYHVADIVSTAGPGSVSRENVQRKTVVSANVSGRDQRSAVKEIRERIKERISLPENYHVELGGQFQSEEEASETLLVTSLLSLIAIFLILFQEFKKVKTSVIILLNLPLALIGGIFSIYFTGNILSIPSIIGFITLFGIATRNGILLISHYQTLENEGMKLQDIILKGSTDRLSPILMTALTAGLALIPLAISGDLPGNEIQSPMAKVILGGLFTSTLLNLIIVPIVYFMMRQHDLRITKTSSDK